MAEPYLERLSELVSALDLATPDNVVVECRHFFSGAALYANGKICASLTPAGLGLKLPHETREGMMAEGEGRELRYFDHSPVKKEYVALAQQVVGDQRRLKALLEESIGYTLRVEQGG